MVCDAWTEKLDAYLDGELPLAEARSLGEHLRGCSACAAESLNRVQQKRAVHAAGQRFTPDPAFRARVQNSIAARKPVRWSRAWFPALAGAMAVLIVGLISIHLNRERRGDQQLLSELADLHVATLASSNPVDVVSTDRHTVKPWFAGKNQISVFIFQERSLGEQASGNTRPEDAVQTALSFNVRSWSHNGLRYFVIGDASAQDLDKLSELMKAAG
jgi:anti-sigma factor RsiW